MLKHPISISTAALFGLCACAALIAACTLPAPGGLKPPTQITPPEIVYTQAVLTVAAQMTKAAPVPNQTQETSVKPTEAPSTAAGTQQFTAAPPTATTQPTSQPTVTVTPLSPTATLLSGDPRARLGTPFWHENFDGTADWYKFEDEHIRLQAKDGKLEMKAFKADNRDGWALAGVSATNAYLEMTVTTGDCAGKDQYGILFRAPSQADKGYLLAFACDGHYALWIWDGKQRMYLIDWTEAPQIVKGANLTNRLGVMLEGNKISVYANGILLKAIQDSTFTKGFFGVFVGAGITSGFTANVSDFSYWELP